MGRRNKRNHWHLDKDGNVYDPQDIYQNSSNPKVIAKWVMNNGTYLIN